MMANDKNEWASKLSQFFYAFIDQLCSYSPSLHVRQHSHWGKPHTVDDAVRTFNFGGTEEDMPNQFPIFYCNKREQTFTVISQCIHNVRFQLLAECQLM